MYWMDDRPWIFKPEDFAPSAAALCAAEWPGEFCFAHPMDVPMLRSACLAGFLPMSTGLLVPDGFGLGQPLPLVPAKYDSLSASQSYCESPEDIFAAWNRRSDLFVAEKTLAEHCFFTPKLHVERCLIAPDKVRSSRSSRKQAALYDFSVDLAFDQVMAACVRTHGDGWLTPPLCALFACLHRQADTTPAPRMLSIELWREDELVAGELGYQIGAVYTSLSGFHTQSGSGNVQLASLAAWLHRQGIQLWDLGMPADYKFRLGAGSYSRSDYLAAFHSSYNEPVRLRAAAPQSVSAVLSS